MMTVMAVTALSINMQRAVAHEAWHLRSTPCQSPLHHQLLQCWCLTAELLIRADFAAESCPASNY